MNMFSGMTKPSKVERIESANRPLTRDAYLASSMDVQSFADKCKAALSLGAALEACHCVGQINGEPVCPCHMRAVTIVNGRYVQTLDLGPAPEDIQGVRVPRVLLKAIGALGK